MKKPVKFMLTAFRDGFQSVYGARVFSKDFLPVVQEAAHIGIHHMEAGGGAMFQSAFFYSNENAFDVMDAFRRAAPEANLQTLARGINVVALDSQPSDIIKLHAQLFKKHGMTTIRNFDALNDVNNLIYSGKCISDAGLKHEVTVTMMELPPGCEGAHTPQFYVNTLKKIIEANIPFDSVCFKDASGTSTPKKVYETIKSARDLLGNSVKIAFHTHETAGIGTTAYLEAIRAGVDQIDLSIAPCSGGTSQPDILTLWHALRGTEWTLDIDISKILKLRNSLIHAMRDYIIPPEAVSVEATIPFFPMPGGALTANTQMLRDNGLMDKYPEMIEAMGEAVARGGFGTSVTPVSQFYFQQAFNNVMFGKWKKIAEGYGKMVLGYIGKTPTPPDPEVIAIAQEQLKLKPTTESPLDICNRDPAKGTSVARKKLESHGLPCTDENIFIAASCDTKGIAFLKGQGTTSVRKIEKGPTVMETKPNPTPQQLRIVLNNTPYTVSIEGNRAVVNGRTYTFEVSETSSLPEVRENPPETKPATTTPETKAAPPIIKNEVLTPPPKIDTPPAQKLVPLSTPLPGIVLRIEKNIGDAVKAGDTVLVIESMKMETALNAPADGFVSAIHVSVQQQVPAGTLVAQIGQS